jgi:prepilin-type N-terminal cleavage/methylation domain-containing protein
MANTLYFRTQRGFTILEIVIAVGLLALLSTMMVDAFGPFLNAKNRNDSEEKLVEVVKAVEAAYKAQAFYVDNSDLIAADGNFPNMGDMVIDSPGGGVPDTILRTVCPAKSLAPGNPPIGDNTDITGPTTAGVSVLQNIEPLQKYSTRSIQELATDGHKNAVCILVSRRSALNYEGVELLYHTVAVIAPGSNNIVEPNTTLVPLQPSGVGTPIVWTLQLDGDDQGLVLDGSQIAIENYKTTKKRLEKFARAYETYFKVRFNNRDVKLYNTNFFYVENGFNNGEPTTGTYTAPPNGLWPSQTRTVLGTRWEPPSFDSVVDTGIWYVLGINDLDLYDAWGFPILTDNRSARVRATVPAGPYTAQFGAFLPGYDVCFNNADDPNITTNNCNKFLTTIAVGKI